MKRIDAGDTIDFWPHTCPVWRCDAAIKWWWGGFRPAAPGGERTDGSAACEHGHHIKIDTKIAGDPPERKQPQKIYAGDPCGCPRFLGLHVFVPGHCTSIVLERFDCGCEKFYINGEPPGFQYTEWHRPGCINRRDRTNWWHAPNKFYRPKGAPISPGVCSPLSDSDIERLKLRERPSDDLCRRLVYRLDLAEAKLAVPHHCPPPLGSPTREEAMAALQRIRELASDVLEHWDQNHHGRHIVEIYAMILAEACKWSNS